MNRTEEFLKLRPQIKRIKQDLDTLEIEQFQNDTLRPILKVQHDLLLALFHTSLTKHKTPFDELSTEKKEEKLNELFQKNLSFKNQSLGAILGLLTAEEFTTYQNDASAYNRRIITMLKQRIMSTYLF